MSVRRLADESVQPESFAFSRENAAWAKQVVKRYPKGRQASAVIPLLMRAQEQEGWVSRATIEYVADMLGMPYIRALEVATFYTQFQIKPVGTKAHIQVCGTTPCMLRGAEDLKRVCREKIHPEQFHTNEGGTLSWEEVECQGACVNAPMVMIFKDTYEDLTPERLAEIIDEFEAGRGAGVPAGPQNGRTYSAPLSGQSTLTDETIFFKENRDRDARAAAKARADAAPVAPTLAAKPKTDAIETSPAVKSPSKVKVSPGAEAAASVKPPREDKKAADKAASGEPRAHSGKQADAVQAFKAPESGKDAGKPESAAAPVVSLDDPNRPAAIERPAQPDDLQLIAGVGPKNERLLHELGIYTWAQIGAWKKAEREWVDSYLRFKGRIEREEWVKQAKALAKGGEAEYIRVFGKKPR
ncbi:MAG: NADH-quinone oxidoreductase subunit E [Aquamicrobium sp.]|uniref:NADH-quinone oxidoreductase subunit E n=1 Tax=Aquamicrobium sp. TaxID=1872579 RepID=UPI00349EB8E7|nr:NADH-quinone oxidoreductase subunit E [Aquamicrobium sp.]